MLLAQSRSPRGCAVLPGQTSARLPNACKLLLPSFGNIIFVSLLLILSIGTGQGLLGDGDTAYHIRTGEIILDSLQVPTHDPYSFHKPAPAWTAHEWLAEVVMATLLRLFGLTGIVIFFAFLLAITHWMLFQSLRSRFNDVLLCLLITLISTVSSSIHWLARPHAFSLFFLVIWSHLLQRFQEDGSDNIKYLPFLMILWVNLHGGFIMGIVLIVVYFGGNITYALLGRANNKQYADKTKKLSLVLLATIGATLLNPFGAEILWFPIRVASDRFIADHVIEFLSPNFHDPLPFKYMLLALIGAMALSRSSLSLIEAVLLVLLCHMALYSARHISLFAVIAAPILLKSVQSLMLRLPRRLISAYRDRTGKLLLIDGRVNGYVWPAAGISLVVVLAVSGLMNYRFSDQKFPVAAVEFLKDNPISGNMFNSDEFGDYLIFTAWPMYRVFMDGRSDMYGATLGRDYLRVAHGLPGWRNVLQKHNISWVFFDTKSPISVILRDQPDWQPIYSDKIATIFVKRISAHSSLLDKFQNVAIAD